jgi:amino acid transporter
LEKKGLAGNALGAFESLVMGIAGTAPAYSVAATTATIFAAVGVQSVGSILFCGWMMFGIMLAYIHLRKIAPNAGAAYGWVGDVFGKPIGFFAGWGLLVASIVFMVSATMPAAQATLELIQNVFHLAPTDPNAVGLDKKTVWVAITSAIWLTVVTIVVARGIKHASYTQILLTGLETAVLIALIAGAFYHYSRSPAHTFSWSWLSPATFAEMTFSQTAKSFSEGALIAIFFYWGWDVTMNLTEETRGGKHDPASRGAFWAMINLILFFCIMMVVVLFALTDEEIKTADTEVLSAIADKLFPAPWSYLAVIATLLSTIGTIETQILQFSRSMFAMARDKMLHPRYAAIHPEWQTPWVATLVIWFGGLVLILLSSLLPTVKEILDDSIKIACFQICFYMSLAAFACAWHYRGRLKDGAIVAVSHVIWPLLSGLFMVFIAGYSVVSYSWIATSIGVGGLAIGLIPLILNRLMPTESAA